MTPSARLAAAIDVLSLIETQRRPAAEALTEWGRAHRFAGSKDRAAIAALLYDALRSRASSAWIMDDTSPRGVLLGSLRETRGLDAAAIAALCTGEGHAPAPLTLHEQERFETGTLDSAPAHVAGNFPEWLEPMLAAALGDGLVTEMRALAQRAPVDLRVNIPRLTRDKAREALSHFGAMNTPRSPFGLRIVIGADGRAPPLAVERTFLKGLFEVQDEGSQLAAMLSGAAPGEQVLDLCAGAGGKTLAMAAQMEGRGQVYAFDGDGRRLAPIFARIERAGARNIQVRSPKGADGLGDLVGPLRSRFRRCTLHGHGHLASASRCEMARAAWRIRAAREAAGRSACAGGPLRGAGWAHRLCHVLPPTRRKRSPRRGLSRCTQRFFPDTRRHHLQDGWSSRPCGPRVFARCGASPVPGDDRNGRLLRRSATTERLIGEGDVFAWDETRQGKPKAR